MVWIAPCDATSSCKRAYCVSHNQDGVRGAAVRTCTKACWARLAYVADEQSKRKKLQQKRRKALVRHRQLVALEVLLLLRWLLREVEQLIRAQDWSPWLQISLIMLMVAGAFGWFLIAIRRATETSMDTTKKFVERMPIPIPMLVVHVCIFILLFIAYAWQLGFIEEIQRDAAEGVKEVQHAIE